MVDDLTADPSNSSREDDQFPDGSIASISSSALSSIGFRVRNDFVGGAVIDRVASPGDIEQQQHCLATTAAAQHPPDEALKADSPAGHALNFKDQVRSANPCASQLPIEPLPMTVSALSGSLSTGPITRSGELRDVPLVTGVEVTSGEQNEVAEEAKEKDRRVRRKRLYLYVFGAVSIVAFAVVISVISSTLLLKTNDKSSKAITPDTTIRPFCSWDGCVDDEQEGGTFCNENEEQCLGCGWGAVWCTALEPPPTGPYCNWNECNGVVQGDEFCNRGLEECYSCGGNAKWCDGSIPIPPPVNFTNSLQNSNNRTPETNSSVIKGFCSWDACIYRAEDTVGSAWCNTDPSSCEICGNGARWCDEPAPPPDRSYCSWSQCNGKVDGGEFCHQDRESCLSCGENSQWCEVDSNNTTITPIPTATPTAVPI